MAEGAMARDFGALLAGASTLAGEKSMRELTYSMSKLPGESQK